MPAGTVPATRRHEDYIAGVGCEQSDAFDQIVALAFQNEPELIVADMEMAAIGLRRRRHTHAADDVAERVIVIGKQTRFVGTIRMSADVILHEIDVWAIVLVVVVVRAVIAHLYVMETRRLGRRGLAGNKWVRGQPASMRDFKT